MSLDVPNGREIRGPPVAYSIARIGDEPSVMRVMYVPVSSCHGVFTAHDDPGNVVQFGVPLLAAGSPVMLGATPPAGFDDHGAPVPG